MNRPAPSRSLRPRRGFTLLEMLVATVILGIAVVGLLSNLSTSLRNASRLSDYDKAALLARRTMNELLLDRSLPKDQILEGVYSEDAVGLKGGWRARLTNFESPQAPAPGVPVVERLELEIWWMSGERRRTLALEGFRRAVIPFPAGGPS
ncbi:MAG: type II secretion system GspH family protein [Bryobacteraceae bacterium]|nr:type II secretion system GspH family protein [Bryobacteraceae bacterium]